MVFFSLTLSLQHDLRTCKLNQTCPMKHQACFNIVPNRLNLSNLNSETFIFILNLLRKFTLTPSFIHEIAGLGKPFTLHLRITSAFSVTVQDFKSSVNSGGPSSCVIIFFAVSEIKFYS